MKKWTFQSIFIFSLGLLACLFGLAKKSLAAEVVDANTGVKFYTLNFTETTSATNWTKSITNPYGNFNTYLICGGIKNNSAPSSATYAGQAMTAFGTTFGIVGSDSFYIKNPTAGANNLVLNFGSGTYTAEYHCWFFNSVTNLVTSANGGSTSETGYASCSDYNYYTLGSNAYSNNILFQLWYDSKPSYFDATYYCNMGTSTKIDTTLNYNNSNRGLLSSYYIGNLSTYAARYYNKSSSLTNYRYVVFAYTNSALTITSPADQSTNTSASNLIAFSGVCPVNGPAMVGLATSRVLGPYKDYADCVNGAWSTVRQVQIGLNTICAMDLSGNIGVGNSPCNTFYLQSYQGPQSGFNPYLNYANPQTLSVGATTTIATMYWSSSVQNGDTLKVVNSINQTIASSTIGTATSTNWLSDTISNVKISDKKTAPGYEIYYWTLSRTGTIIASSTIDIYFGYTSQGVVPSIGWTASSSVLNFGPTEINVHALACTAEEWAEAEAGWFNWTKLKCRTFETALNIGQTIAHLPSTIADFTINRIKAIFPFSLVAGIYDSWTTAANQGMPEQLGFLFLALDNDGNIWFDFSGPWTGIEEPIVVFGPALFRPEGTTLDSFFGAIRNLTTISLWVTFFYSLYAFGIHLKDEFKKH